MGWQRDEIEELAEELEIDGGDSWSQQDRMRNIAEQVGMDHYDGLSNDDTDMLQEILKQRKAQKQRNIDNNEKNIRAAASVLKDKGIPYASEIAAAVDAADKISGGRTTRDLGKKLNTINKMAGATPGGAGKKLQRASNRLAESGMTDAINDIDGIRSGMKNGNGDMGSAISSMASKKDSDKSTTAKGKIKFEIPPKVKIVSIVVIAVIALVAVAILTLFGAEMSVSGSAGGSGYEYGQTCTTITVENTGCDSNDNNCTLVYDGEVELEDYVAGVVAAEVGNDSNLEYYKVLAIAARTYLFENVKDDCTVDGNAKFQKYMDVDDAPNSSLIKQAVKETENLVLIENGNLMDAYYSSACVVNADSNYYYVRYGTKSLREVKFQQIPKEWDQNNSTFNGYLANWYSMTDNSNTDYDNKDCPNNHDYGMSLIGAFYLITQENYSYEDVIEYYYGTNVEILENGINLVGIDGFINPIRRINCTSPFGPRPHPVSGEESTHNGLDISNGSSEPIYAAKDGTVIGVVNNVSAINNCSYGYGNYVMIEHEDGISTLYAHIKYDTIPDSIYVGAKIHQGEQIGAVGSTGCSTGLHLHYEVRKNGSRLDPADYLNLTDATGTCRR